MSLREVAIEHARFRSRLVLATATGAAGLWLKVDPRRISQSWTAAVARLLLMVSGAQRAASDQADPYLAEASAEQDVTTAAAGRVNSAALAGVASDGQNLASLLYQPAILTLSGIAHGLSVDEALIAGGDLLDKIVRTQVADAGRAADQVATVARAQMTGYVRMIVGRTCSRCTILAGRRYEWNSGFKRHPRCDCIHVPAREDTADEIRTDPDRYFRSLSRGDQDRIFTLAGAQAIRDGADINQVVNARRGAHGLTPAGARLTAAEQRMLRGARDRGRLERVDVFGHQVFVTTEGRTIRGLAGKRLSTSGTVKVQGARYQSARTVRLMPESIYEIAGGDRDEAIRLLRVHGYLI